MSRIDLHDVRLSIFEALLSSVVVAPLNFLFIWLLLTYLEPIDPLLLSFVVTAWITIINFLQLDLTPRSRIVHHNDHEDVKEIK